MKKIPALLATAFTYFCIATVLALGTAGGAIWYKGALDRDRIYRVLAALHGIDMIHLQKEIVAQQEETMQEEPSYEQKLKQQTIKSLDLDLREQAITNGLAELKQLQSTLQTRSEEFHQLAAAYDAKLEKLAEEEQTAALEELQTTLAAIKPEQAKEQILKMLEDGAIDDVVEILTNMPIDKQKKIIAEFQQGPESDALYDILKHIRLGEPLASQIQDARQKLGNME